jgi:SAM-dependent methyltransferase
MSSPIAKSNKGFFDKILIAIHRKVSHSKRVDILSTLLAEALKSINPGNRELQLLDVGCGDMSVARSLASKYGKLHYTCIDIYPNTEQWDNYQEFDGKTIPFNDKKFDVVLFSDVLHHDSVNIKTLLMEAKRVSEIILIKDHFEYGLWSRSILQLADIIGNYGYGVAIPERYFSKQSFMSLLAECNLSEIEQICPLQLYINSFAIRLFVKDKYQFISIIH